MDYYALHTRDYAVSVCAELMADEDEDWTYLPSPVNPDDPNSRYQIVVLDEDFVRLGAL